MSTGNPLEQLRRRMQSHATPTAFAALAEEHRRVGRFDEAIAVCRDGLARYPAYVSARVTLGRALLDSGDVTGALAELEQAVAQAPDNLAAARALESAHTALGNAPPPPPLAPLADLPLHATHDDSASIPASVVAQALGSGPDGPQEFGLGPDWSIPGEPEPTAPDAVDAAAEGAADDESTQAIVGHAEAPTMYISPQHLQGEEPAGIWPVPESGAIDAHESLDAARVFSWALDPPAGGDASGAAEHVAAANPAPVNVWDEPTIEASVAFDLFGSGDAFGAAEELASYEAVVSVEQNAFAEAPASPDDEAPASLDESASFGWLTTAEDSVALTDPDHEVKPTQVEESAVDEVPAIALAAEDVAAEPARDDAAAGPDEPVSPFWTGAFGGEPALETPAPFSAWGDEPPPQEAGDARSPWAEETVSDQSGPWVVPDGPSAAWALGDLTAASGADVTPFASATEPVAELPTPTLLAEPAPVAIDVVTGPSVDVAWEGSVKSALGEVFARAGSGESLEPPTHPSATVRTAMADAAVEAALEDAVLRDDAPTPALASLQQMLDSVRARRAALFGDLHS